MQKAKKKFALNKYKPRLRSLLLGDRNKFIKLTLRQIVWQTWVCYYDFPYDSKQKNKKSQENILWSIAISAKLGLGQFKTTTYYHIIPTYHIRLKFLDIPSTVKQAWEKTMKQLSLSQLIWVPISVLALRWWKEEFVPPP